MRVAVAGATGLVGRRLVQAARQAGHDVLELSRSAGVDLAACPNLDLSGVDAVIDVTNAPSLDQDEATAFFTTVAETLGRAATAAGVPHTVVLSIIGVDKPPENGYFIAKLAHERATRGHAPAVRVLRSAQFHDFARQMLAWRRDGDTAAIPDLPIQPVDLDEVVRVLLELATRADAAALTELAGPQPERLPDMVARLDPSVTVRPQPVSDAARARALQPGPDTIIAGPTFDNWLTQNR
ncbi:MAG TPA: NAD(P)H-binding protein [Pseudonocardiaceae bacterium]|nr:NAD(P)H-binding protein [Pseudonocardiaceae bacterium]